MRWYIFMRTYLVPSIFNQLYTIHGINYSKVVPVVYILLPNKKRRYLQTYVFVIKFVKATA